MSDPCFDDDPITYRQLVTCQDFERDPCPRTLHAVKRLLEGDAGHVSSLLNSRYFVKWIRLNKPAIAQTTAMMDWELALNNRLYWDWLHSSHPGYDAEGNPTEHP